MGQGDPGGQYQSGLDRSGRTEIPYFRSTSLARPTSASGSKKRTSIRDLAMSQMCQRTNPLARERAVREGRSQWRQWSDEASRIG